VSASDTARAAAELDEMGPIDYVVIEWPNRQPSGEATPLLLELVDRGIIRILDIALLAKDADGTVGALDFADLASDSGFGELVGATSGLLGQDDLDEAARALEPGTAAAILLFENRWAAPFARAVRQSGGQLVANGRIPIQAMLASLDAIENR
jgi:Family of unknown function (DUF6325)